MHNTTWAPNTMLSSRKKKTKEAIPWKLLDRMDKPYLQDPSGHSQGSNKRISQLRGIAVDNQNKTQYNLAYHTSLT